MSALRLQQQEDGRSTTFQPVTGGEDARSGPGLLVGAYAFLWVVLIIWLIAQWRKQSGLNRRIDELEALLKNKGSGAPPNAS